MICTTVYAISGRYRLTHGGAGGRALSRRAGKRHSERSLIEACQIRVFSLSLGERERALAPQPGYFTFATIVVMEIPRHSMSCPVVAGHPSD